MLLCSAVCSSLPDQLLRVSLRRVPRPRDDDVVVVAVLPVPGRRVVARGHVADEEGVRLARRGEANVAATGLLPEADTARGEGGKEKCTFTVLYVHTRRDFA